jgi:5,10-methylene-tetrahydrofolate dehydrogenase/methenyl tetrahydrofolate cyclohydrolase
VPEPLFAGCDGIDQQHGVIDVGINRLKDGRACRRRHIDGVAAEASFITPVPGGGNYPQVNAERSIMDQ